MPYPLTLIYLSDQLDASLSWTVLLIAGAIFHAPGLNPNMRMVNRNYRVADREGFEPSDEVTPRRQFSGLLP